MGGDSTPPFQTPGHAFPTSSEHHYHATAGGSGGHGGVNYNDCPSSPEEAVDAAAAAGWHDFFAAKQQTPPHHHGSPGDMPHVASPPRANGDSISSPSTPSRFDPTVTSPSSSPNTAVASAHPRAGGSLTNPTEETLRSVPKTDVAQAYLLGQRNAIHSAFQEALPQRQLLGAIQLALADVRGRQEDTGGRCETLERHAAVTDEGARRTQSAVDALLHINVPALERALGELRARQEVVEDKVGRRSLTSLTGEITARVFRGALTHAARVDVIAAIIAKRVLYVGGEPSAAKAGGRGKEEGGAHGHDDGRHGAADGSHAGGAASWGDGLVGTAMSNVFGDNISELAREALGTLLVVAAAEGGFRLQRSITRRMPAAVQTAAGPVALGMQVARAAVWASALTLAAGAVKDWCYRAADYAATDVEENLKRAGSVGGGGGGGEEAEEGAEKQHGHDHDDDGHHGDNHSEANAHAAAHH